MSMKYLRRFKINENLSREQFFSLEDSFKKFQVTPPTQKLPLSQLYRVLFFEVSNPIENFDNPGESGNYLIMIPSQTYLSVHESLDYAVDFLTNDPDGEFDYCGDWEVFKSQNNVVNILEYNDVNFAEIDNLFTDYNITIDNMWGLLRV